MCQESCRNHVKTYGREIGRHIKCRSSILSRTNPTSFNIFAEKWCVAVNWTPFLDCFYHDEDSWEIAKYLLKYYTIIEVFTEYQPLGPLCITCNLGSEETVRLLLDTGRCNLIFYPSPNELSKVWFFWGARWIFWMDSKNLPFTPHVSTNTSKS